MAARILGISAYYHDSAAALVVDGDIVAAAQEERFTRIKHDHNFPTHAVQYCLKEAGLRPEELDYVVFYDKPLLKFERLIETYVSFAPVGLRSFLAAMPLWLKTKLHLPREIRKSLEGRYQKRIVFTGHHESHAASAFFPSPFEEAAILTMDGVGEWDTASIGRGRGNKIELLKTLRFPHSLGLLYSAFTYFTGFKVNSGEYKLMGLAPYGESKYVDVILDKLVDLKEDGSLAMDMRYFNYCQGLTMTGPEFDRLFDGPPRNPESVITQREMDLAASIQKVTEQAVLRMARTAKQLVGSNKLVLAGGVALNCVANGVLLREKIFDDLWIVSAAGDAGGALGAALFVNHQLLDRPRAHLAADGKEDGTGCQPVSSGCQPGGTAETVRAGEKGFEERERSAIPAGRPPAAAGKRPGTDGLRTPSHVGGCRIYKDALKGSLLGPRFSNEEIRRFLDGQGVHYTFLEKEEDLLRETAKAMAEGAVVGWFCGRMEFGPRALGSRSIIGDARSETMQSVMNLRIKHRESFRPFAPSCLVEDVSTYFDLDRESPYMLLVADVRKELQCELTDEQKRRMKDPDLRKRVNVKRSSLPAITHVDMSARIQTVDEERHGRYHRLIREFKRQTGCGVIINTSFNIRGEPIVCTPQDAYRCFLATEMDVLVLENCFLRKREQPQLGAAEKKKYIESFKLD